MSETDTTPDTSTGTSRLSDEIHDVADRIVRRYPVARSALLPLLHLVQSEQNHITDEGIAFCAEKVGLTRAEVGAVATFYTMYKRQPVGDWLLSVCTNPPCKIAGGQQIYDNYVAALGGHSDPDTRVTVEHAECLGICDGAPVVQVNYEMFGPMTVAEGDQLLAACRKGEPPVSPWSGETPPTFAEVERDLSGANDAWEDQLHLAALQQIAFEQPPTYRTGETDLPVTHPGGDPAGVGGAHFREQAAGGDRTALGRPEVPVDPDEDDATAMDGDVAQRIGQDEMGEVAEAAPGTPVEAEVDVPVERAAAHVDLVPEDAEALTTEAAPDSSELAGDVRRSAPPTVDPEPGTARESSSTDDADTQPASEHGDLEEAEATGADGEPVTAHDTADDAAEDTAEAEQADAEELAAAGDADAPAPDASDPDPETPEGVTAASETAVAGEVPVGTTSDELEKDADAADADADDEEDS